MSIQTELTRLTNAKAAIKAAIEGKGVTVPAATLLDGMAALIEAIEAGGGGGNFSIETGTITFAESYKPYSAPLVISHSLGKVPFAFIAYNGASGYYPADQIAYLFKLGIYFRASTEQRSGYSTILYSYKAGNNSLSSISSNNMIQLSQNDITVSSTSSALDFNPDKSGTHTSTLVWFAIAEN